MTLIAFACKGDSADFIIDTACYLPNARKFRRTSKAFMLPHLDAAFMSAGPGPFTATARALIHQESEAADCFDELVEVAPECLQDAWGYAHEDAEPNMSGTSYLIGYSTDLGEFAAYEFSADTDFAAERITGTHVQPALWTVQPRPSVAASELKWLSMGESEEGIEGVRKFCDEWLERPTTELPIPRDLTGWVALALMTREQRSLQGPFGRVYIAGQLLHTRLHVGDSSTMKIWDFDDDPAGEEFRKMVKFSDHPVSQFSPCPCCDSGKLFVDCHMRENFDKPCLCGSKMTLGECCAITETTPCDCGSGQAFRECCAFATALHTPSTLPREATTSWATGI